MHRDIKPANVLLRRRQHGLQAYLADFGIARQVGVGDGLTLVGGTVGTPSYMAPELHTGSQAGVASDIYSLGCLLWAAISGAAPYSGTSDYQVVNAHLELPIPQLRADRPAAEAVNRVLLRSLAKQPAARYSDALEMSRELRAAATLAERSGELAEPAPTGSPGEPPRRSRRRVGLVVLAVALVLGVGIGAAVALTADEETPAPPSPAPTSSPAPTRLPRSVTPTRSGRSRA